MTAIYFGRRVAVAPPWPSPLQHRVRSFHASTRHALRVLFFGTDDVSLHTLRRLHESSIRGGRHPGLISALDVVCPGDRPAGRGRKVAPVPVKQFAVAHRLRTHEVPFGL